MGLTMFHNHVSACACMGPIGNDPLCPCKMRQAGLEPTEIWTTKSQRELKAALVELFNIETEHGITPATTGEKE